MDINIIVKDISALAMRVTALEQGLNDMATKMESVEEQAVKAKIYAHEARDKSAEAVVLLTAAKGVGGFIAKHGPRALAAVAGVMAYKGLIDTNLAAQIAGIFVQ